MNERGKKRLRHWTDRLVEAETNGVVDEVITEIGREGLRLQREGQAMTQLYAALYSLHPKARETRERQP
jgi:hypothetical protein